MGRQRDELHGRVAVITGSPRGLGFAMARLLGRHGAHVVLASRSEADVAEAVGRLHAEGIAASGRRCDIGDLADVEALRDEALRHRTRTHRASVGFASSLTRCGRRPRAPESACMA